METKIVSNWPVGSAAKTATLFFGYFTKTSETRRYYSVLLNRLLCLAQEERLQLLYLDNSIEERRVVVFRFVSEEAYNDHRDELVRMAVGLEKGVWEPNRNQRQHNKWLSELPDATPTIGF